MTISANKRTKKDEQHIIPRIYLKYFKISRNINKVFCFDFSNKYNHKVQTLGLNDKAFKQRKYYNSNVYENPYIIEDVLGNFFEPRYDIIVKEIIKEVELNIETRKNICQWIYLSKIRSPYYRFNIESVIKSVDLLLEDSKQTNDDLKSKSEKEKYLNILAKGIHLKSFTDKGIVELLVNCFVDSFSLKHWRILKSQDELPFITNDNPGFSFNLDFLKTNQNPYSPLIDLNINSVIYFVLTPKYCIEMTPFHLHKGTPIETNAFNMHIDYEKVPYDVINSINKGIVYTKHKLLISNKINMIESLL